MSLRRILRGLVLTLALAGLTLAWLYGALPWPAPRPLPPSLSPSLSASDPGASRPAPAPLEAPRVLIVGTSLIHNEIWVEELAARLTACNPRSRLETLARPGASSRWGAAQLSTRLRRGEAPPDIVVIEFAINDASLLRGLPLLTSRRLHAEMIAAARAEGAEVLLATMSPAWGRNRWERPGLPRYEALYRELAAATDIGLIETAPLWQDLPAAQRRVWIPDGLHPVTDGARAITLPAFLAALEPRICR